MKLENNNSIHLITTYNTLSWKMGKNIFYLGRWCIPIDNEKEIDLEKNCLNYHWNDQNKRRSDHNYLNSFYEKVLKDLCTILNKHHNTNLEHRSWRLILGPWLMSLIANIWDKYESLRLFYEEKNNVVTDIIQVDELKFIPFDYYHYVNKIINNDLWNHWIYGRIIEKVFSKNTQINFKKNLNTSSKNLIPDLNTLKTNYIKKIFGINFFMKNKNLLIESSNLPLKNNLKINYYLKQFPFWPIIFTKNSLSKFQNNKNLKIRKKILTNFKCENEFENFIKNNLFLLMPMSYLENFNHYRSEAFKIKFNGKGILSTGMYWSDDLFKIWCANQIEKNKFLFITYHGGGISYKNHNFDHDEKISDKVLVWHNPTRPNQIKLPSLSVNKKISRKSSENILITLFPNRSYHVIRCDNGPLSTQCFDDFIEKKEFIEKIEGSINNIKVRIARQVYMHDIWNFKKRLIKSFGENIIDKEKSFSESLSKAKIHISGYPATTMSESIASNIPTICLYNKDFWEFSELHKDLVSEMKKNNVLIDDKNAATIFLKKINKNINDWWFSKDVQYVINEYKYKIHYLSKDGVKPWVNFIKENIC